jgi:hypothetical protein
MAALWAALASGGSSGHAQDRDKPLNGRRYVAIFEVRDSKLISEVPTEFRGISIRRYEVRVRIASRLPKPPARSELTLTVEHGVGLEGDRIGLQNWLPTQEGARFVALFDSERPQEGEEFDPLAVGEGVGEVWKDCEIFVRALQSKGEDWGRTLAETIKDNVSKLGPTFFDLVFNSGVGHEGDEKFVLALAGYLETREVCVEKRAEVIQSSIRLPDTLEGRLVSRMGCAILRAAIDAYDLNQEKRRAVDVIWRFADLCIDREFAAVSPDSIDEEVRESLRRILNDDRLEWNDSIRAEVKAWLDPR